MSSEYGIRARKNIRHYMSKSKVTNIYFRSKFMEIERGAYNQRERNVE